MQKEMRELRHALSVAVEQGSREEFEARIEQLGQRVDCECSLFLVSALV